jgi:hypothetical protein
VAKMMVKPKFLAWNKKAVFYSLLTLIICGSLFFMYQTYEAKVVALDEWNFEYTKYQTMQTAVSDIATTYREIYQIDALRISQNNTHNSYQFNGTYTLTNRVSRLNNLVLAYNTQKISREHGLRISGNLSDTLYLAPHGYMRIGENNLTIGGVESRVTPSRIAINATTNVNITNFVDSFSTDPSGTLVQFSVKDITGTTYSFSKVLNGNETNEVLTILNGSNQVVLYYGQNNSVYGNGTLNIRQTGMELTLRNITIEYPRNAVSNSSGAPFLMTNGSVGISYLDYVLTQGILISYQTNKSILRANIP